MESTIHDRPQSFSTTEGSSPTSRDINATAEKAASAIHNAAKQVADSAAETADQAKQKAGELYDQVNKTINDQVNRAVDYTRENPGKTTLIAFGIGVEVGALLLGSARGGSRRRRHRVVEPVMNAISTLAYDLFG
jgi:ElaB/YqjD/DUF883 family membrane-anchored ribosome-binding protein